MFKPRQIPAAATASSPPTVEWVRQRAKHRLLGVGVLVLAGVLVFPMLFDTQPRPIPVDIPIEIPSRQSVKPLTTELPASAAAGAEDAPDERIPPPGRPEVKAEAGKGKEANLREEVIAGSAAATRVQEARSPVAAPAPKPTAPPAAVPVARVVVVPPKPVAEAKPAAEVKPKVTPPPSVHAAPVAPVVAAPAPPHATPPDTSRASESARARALLEGRPVAIAKAAEPPAPADGQRFIVQVGAFAELTRAQQVRSALERVGLKTYTHVTDTPEGKRIRVRLGPFATRADAEKAAAKAKTTGVPAAILTL